MTGTDLHRLALGLMLALPLALALLAGVPRRRTTVARLTPWTPLPALLVALFLPDGTVVAPGLLLGLHLGLDPVGRTLLGAAALLWLAAGLARAPTRRGPPLIAWHLTLAGNLGAVVTLDRAGFYFWFALLSLAVYVLLVERGDTAAHRAGRLYLGVAIGAELLALGAILLLADGRAAEVAALLLFFGLGAKLGVLPLHFPLPLAYAAASPAVGTLFGGALSLAAVAGLLRFLPTAPGAGDYLIYAGLATAFTGVLLGLTQRAPRALLGYSTVSQMGILTCGLGVALAAPRPEVVLTAVALFAVHHGLVKGALLLGAGGGRRALPWLAALSLALAAVPFSGGAAAKLWLEAVTPHHGAGAALHLLLPFTSLATLLLMARFLALARAQPDAAGPPRPFTPLALAALVLPAGLALLWHPAPGEFVTPGHLWAAAWPPLLGLAVAVVAWRRPPRRQPSLPPGDVAALGPRLVGRWRRVRRLAWRPPVWRWQAPEAKPLARIEDRIRALPLTGVLFFALVLALLGLGLAG